MRINFEISQQIFLTIKVQLYKRKTKQQKFTITLLTSKQRRFEEERKKNI